jgi:hypothetical protein
MDKSNGSYILPSKEAMTEAEKLLDLAYNGTGNHGVFLFTAAHILDTFAAKQTEKTEVALKAMREALTEFAKDSNWVIEEGPEYVRPSGLKGVTHHRWVSDLDGRILATKALEKRNDSLD